MACATSCLIRYQQLRRWGQDRVKLACNSMHHMPPSLLKQVSVLASELCACAFVAAGVALSLRIMEFLDWPVASDRHHMLWLEPQCRLVHTVYTWCCFLPMLSSCNRLLLNLGAVCSCRCLSCSTHQPWHSRIHSLVSTAPHQS
jgi:hypothetical protein